MSESRHEGDGGKTGFLGKGKLSKSGLRFETLGSLDEAQAALGLVRSGTQNKNVARIIFEVQTRIPMVMAEAAADLETVKKLKTISSADSTWIDDQVKLLEQSLKIPNGFIIPGSNESGARIDLARTVVRRAERNLVRMHESGELNNPTLLVFWNRLSLLLFYLELAEENSGNYI